LTVWEDAARLYREMDDGQGIVESMLQIAQVYFVLGIPASVGTYLDQAEDLVGERRLETFKYQLLFLRGMQMMSLRKYDAARDFFTQSEQLANDAAESEPRLLLRLRMAECDHRMGRHEQAVTLARIALDCGERTGQRQVVAEASYLLGTIATASPVSVPETALPHFKAGFEAIAREPVTEVTWKLAFALGKEFQKRGQRIKAREYFRRARLVLRFFLAQFRSSMLKNSYLGAENRQKALAFLDSTLTT
jgi:tetratricopeptide (TPR) repeat protein